MFAYWPQRETVLGPLQVDDGLVTLREPQLRDAEAWSAARLANQQWLERAFPAWGDDWAAEQQPVDWVERWWRLRRLARRGLARPLVLELDGRLIGEVGVDAVDALSHTGEMSVWLVRDHGSGAVLNAAWLLLINHMFTGADPLDRIIAPGATTARRGLTPGMTAAGFAIEATVARKVGAQGMVDHDVWVLHNTAEVRRRVADRQQTLAHDPVNSPTVPLDRRTLATAVARAAMRGSRATLRASRAADDEWLPPESDGAVTLRAERRGDGTVRGRRAVRAGSLVLWTIVHGEVEVGRVRVQNDAGTGISELFIDVEPGTDRSVLAAALDQALRALAERRLTVAVRVATATSRGRQQPDADMLTGAGLVLVATFAGNPETRYDWAGEQRWEFPRPQ